jgi:hypothetical protein
VIEPTEAAVVQRVFREYAIEGLSQWEIVRGLVADGIAAQKRGWHQGTISNMLRSRTYLGEVNFGGQHYPGSHEAIVKPDLWAKAAALRAANLRSESRKGREPVAGHLLAYGLLRCGRCGAAMNAITKPTRTPGRLYEAYICSGRKTGCEEPLRRRGPIDAGVWRLVSETAVDVEATRTMVAEQHQAERAEAALFREQAQRDRAKADARLTRVRRDYQDAKLDADDWREQRDELTAELDAAQAKLDRFAARESDLAGEVQDVEESVLAQMTELRAMIVGDARERSHDGLKAFRAALRRLFVGFELVPPGSLGSGGLDGVIWPQDRGLVSRDGYALVPYVRPEALRLDADDVGSYAISLLIESPEACPATRCGHAEARAAECAVVSNGVSNRPRIADG